MTGNASTTKAEETRNENTQYNICAYKILSPRHCHLPEYIYIL